MSDQNIILSLVQRELEQCNEMIEETIYENRFNVLIPKDERAATYKRHRIDGVEGTVKHYTMRKNACRAQIGAAANEFLRRAGFNWDASVTKPKE